MGRARPVRAALALALGAALALAARAHAEPCDPALGRPFAGPPELGVREGGLGVPRAPCARRELDLRLVAGATVDTPDFYGTLGAAAELELRWPIGRFELSGEATFLDWRFAQNASVKASEATAGPVAFGLLWQGSGRILGLPVSFAPALRVVVPATRLGVDGERGGGELALHLGLRPERWLTVHAHAGALALLVADATDGTRRRDAAWIGAGAGVAVGERFVLLAGVEAGAGFYDDGLDHVLVRAGVRLLAGWAGELDLAAALPLAGAERADALVLLGWSVPLEPGATPRP